MAQIHLAPALAPRQQCAGAAMLSKSPSQLRLNNNLDKDRTSSTDLKKHKFVVKDSCQAEEYVGELDLLYLQSLRCEQLHSPGIKLNRCWLLFVNMSKVVYLNSVHVNRVLSPLNWFCFICLLMSHSREWFMVYLKPSSTGTSCTALLFCISLITFIYSTEPGRSA